MPIFYVNVKQNYDNFLKFVHMLTDDKGLNISQRNITASTCGIVPKIRQLAEEKFQMALALSLHATTQEKRKQLMPIANKYDLKEVLDACHYYYEQTGRRVTFEYILLKGINDSLECADELSDLIRGTLAYVNLIPYNPVIENEFKRSDDKQVRLFMDRLIKRGVTCTIRKEFGTDIDAGFCECYERRVRQCERHELG